MSAPYQVGSDTSQATAASVENADTLRARVREYLKRVAGDGATDDEMQLALDMNPSTQRPRRVELVDRGVVVDSGRRRPTQSDRQAVVWVIAANMADKTCRDTVWLTPPKISACVRAYFPGGFTDPATQPDNPMGARTFWTEADDGLSVSWALRDIFVNPPYGRALSAWVAKIGAEAAQGTVIVALLPANRLETSYMQASILRNPALRVMCLYGPGRAAFLRPDGIPAKGNTQGSIIYGLGVDRQRFARAFASLGPCLEVKLL